jgi:NADH dehydrogenase
MENDNVVSPGALTFADLGITATPLEAVAPSYLRRTVRRTP